MLQADEILWNHAYEPAASRENLANAVGSAIDILKDEDDSDSDDSDEDSDED